MSNNYRDIYIRKNPRENIKCEPSIYQDKYIIKTKEQFTNSKKKKNFMNPKENLDNFFYLGKQYDKVFCDKGKMKYKDTIINTDINNLNKKNFIDHIHNEKILQTTNYNSVYLQNLKKIKKRLGSSLNQSIISINERVNYFPH